MVAQVAEPQPSASQQPGLSSVGPDPKSEPPLDSAKTLICALNFLSRNLPLPQHVYDAVSTIYQDAPPESSHEDLADEEFEAEGDVVNGAASPPRTGKFGVSSYNELMSDFEDAVLKQRSSCFPGSKLSDLKGNRYQSRIQHRLTELEGLPTSGGEELQSRCLLELYGLKLAELQSKVRSEVGSEYWLRLHCANPDKQLFDWGMMRLRRPLYGIGDAFATEADDPLRKKRDAERLSRFEEEEKNRIETRKMKFFSELSNACHELQTAAHTSQKRRKQRNDGVQAWHGRLRQRATRAEKLRFQALKADDQEAYMKMVEESKNERLTMLLGKTNDLLVRLGAAVQRQKDAGHDVIEPLHVSESELPDFDDTPAKSLPEEVEEVDDESKDKAKTGDLLEGQRKYNSAVHSIQEKVSEQPSMLQGGELRQYQIEGLQWMLSLFNNNLNGILADEMGLGKTIQTIALIAYLIENKGVTGPHLIVAPKAVLPNWVNEFKTWAPSISAILYDGRIDERKAMKEEISGEGKFNVLITHYDLIIRDKIILRKINWHYLIVDEGHRLKNFECVLSQTLASGYQFRRRLLLTGTPIQNSLQELWSLLNFLLPNIFNSVENFEDWFNAPFADKCDVSLTDEEQLLVIRRLHHVIRPFILRRKKDEVEKFLPGKTQVILKCDMSAWQKVYYQQVTEMGRVGLAHGSGKSKSLQNLTMQLRKCCNHPYLFLTDYFMQRSEDIVRSSGKFELLDRLLPKLHRAGHRILLFSQMTKLMTILGDYLSLKGYQFLRLDGTTNTGDRGELLRQFNAPDSPYFIFLLSTRAGGLGLNLQTADTVIIFDSDWNPQMDQQAEDRAHRIGQKKEVRVFVLVSVGSIEEVILERAKQKMGIDAKVIQAGLFNTTSTAQDRREMLEEIMRRGTSALGTDVPSERQINRLAARSDEEFWMFEKMDEERRLRENYRSRLMEEHEVPEWVYTVPDINSGKGKGSLNFDTPVTGKRLRKEVIRDDTISDSQWRKAVGGSGDDVFSNKSTAGKKRRENQNNLGTPKKGNNNNNNNSNNVVVIGGGNNNGGVGEDNKSTKVVELKSETVSVASEGKSEDDVYGQTSQRREGESSQRSGLALDGFTGLTWKSHKRKRSSLN